MIYLTTKNEDIADLEIELCSVEKCLRILQNLKNDFIELDTESIGNRIILIQFGTNSDQFVIDLTTTDIILFKPLLERKDKTFILHNAKHDLKLFLKQNIDVKSVYDTFVVEMILTTGYNIHEKHLALNDLCKKYLSVTLDKNIRHHIHRLGVCTSVVKYAAKDVMYMRAIMNQQLNLIGKWELQNIMNLENKLVRVFSKMEHRGIKFDVEKWANVSKTALKNLAHLENKLDEIILELTKTDEKIKKRLLQYINVYKVGNLFFDDVCRKTNINWNSSQQKVKILKILGLDISSSDKNVLKDNINKHDIIPVLIDYSEAAKLVSAFGSKFLEFVNSNTGRIHSNHWQIISTGRISMSNPNLQQIPSHGELSRAIRSSFVATKGYKMVCADYDSFELTIIAEFSQDPLWIEIITEGRDLHGELCSKTFGIPLEDISKPFPHKKEFTYRDVQKTIDFMLTYGGSEHKLASVIKVDIREARKIIEDFFNKIPKVKKFLNLTGELAKLRGYIATPRPLRRIRWFPEWKEMYKNYKQEHLSAEDFKILGSIERKGKNTPIQGTNANLIKKALIMLQDEIDKNNWGVHLLLTVHDEILSEVVEDQAEEWSKVKQEIMIDCTKDILKTVPVRTSPVIEYYWSK